MIGNILIFLLLFLTGIYFIYAAFYLKKGFLEKVLAMPEQAKVPPKEKLDAFIKKMFPITLATGCVGTLTATVYLVDFFTGLLRGIPYYLVLVYLVTIVTYGYFSTHARNRYL